MHQQEQFSLAAVTLKPGKEAINKWARKQLQEYQKNYWVHLDVDTWIEYNLEQEVQKIQKWATIKFTLTFTDPKFKSSFTRDIPVPTILSSISHIEFPVLKVLSLQNHSITSIETLARLNAPSLEVINLPNNQISCLKSLRKSICPFTNILLDSPLMVSAADFEEMNIEGFCKIKITNSLKKLTSRNRISGYIFNKNHQKILVEGFPLKTPQAKYSSWIEEKLNSGQESSNYQQFCEKFKKPFTNRNFYRNHRINFQFLQFE